MATWLWQEQIRICNLPLTLNSCTTLHRIGDCAPGPLPGAARGSALTAMPCPVLPEGTGPRKRGHAPWLPGHSGQARRASNLRVLQAYKESGNELGQGPLQK